MHKTFIALMIASVVLTGCGKSDEEIRQEQAAQAAQLELIAQQNAKAQQEADDLELAGVIAELKKGDPLIKDAYYGYNEKGERTLHVVRDNPPQPVQAQPQYQQGANGQPVIINNQPAQQASGGVSESIWPLAAGVGAGMLLANAMNSGGGYNNYQQSHRPYSNNYYSDNDYRRERVKVVNNYHTTVVKQTREVVRTNPTYQQQARLNSVQRPVVPAVKPNTGASFGQTQPRVQPQTVQARPVVKPASSGWGSSSTASTVSKPTVKPSSSGWGSSNSSSSSRSSYTPSRSSSSSSYSSSSRSTSSSRR